jgi:hypothetical protein
MKNSIKVLAFLASSVFASASANAVVLASPTGPLDTAMTFSTTFNSTGGSSAIAFDLLGYASLDGLNFYEDDFRLSLNGTEIFSGTFSLGGGGTNLVFTDLIGSVISGLRPDVVDFAGGDLLISGVINALVGSNTLLFSYGSLVAGHAGFQGLGDEGWGVNNLNVANVSSVPVPGAALLLGTGLIGLAGLRRRAKKA